MEDELPAPRADQVVACTCEDVRAELHRFSQKLLHDHFVELRFQLLHDIRQELQNFFPQQDSSTSIAPAVSLLGDQLAKTLNSKDGKNTLQGLMTRSGTTGTSRTARTDASHSSATTKKLQFADRPCRTFHEGSELKKKRKLLRERVMKVVRAAGSSKKNLAGAGKPQEIVKITKKLGYHSNSMASQLGDMKNDAKDPDMDSSIAPKPSQRAGHVVFERYQPGKEDSASETSISGSPVHYQFGSSNRPSMAWETTVVQQAKEVNKKPTFTGDIVDAVQAMDGDSSDDGGDESEASSHSEPMCVACDRRMSRKIVESEIFEFGIAFLILVNALTMGLQTNVMLTEGLAELPSQFVALDLSFCIAFTIEILIRLHAYRARFFCTSDCYWNIFDFCMVLLQIVEEVYGLIAKFSLRLTIMRVLRIFRLVRMFRVVRILRRVRDLRMLTFSVAKSIQPLFWTILILFIMIYILAIFFCTFIVVSDRHINRKGDDLDHYYSSLWRTILSLWQSISGGLDWDVISSPLISELNPILGVFFALYIAFSLLAMMNVITGVFLENAMIKANQERDIYMVNQVYEVFKVADTNNKNTISWPEFKTSLKSSEVQELFKFIDIDISEAKGLFELLDNNGNGSIAYEEFLSGCLRVRGPAKSLDLWVHHRESARGFAEMSAEVGELEHRLAQIAEILAAGLGASRGGPGDLEDASIATLDPASLSAAAAGADLP